MRKTKKAVLESFAQINPVQHGSMRGSSLGSNLAEVQRVGTASQRLLADYLLKNPIRVVALSIEELSRATSVSTATLSRFARELGYSGYAEMRSAIADALHSVVDPVVKLRDRLDSHGEVPADQMMIRSLEGVLAHLDGDALKQQIERISGIFAGANNVHIAGFGYSAHVAGMMALGLEPFHPGVRSIVEFGGSEVAAGRLMRLKSEDVVVAITFPRYARDIVSMTEFARNRGSTIIAITDGPGSPIARLAHELVIAPCEHPLMSTSMIGAVAIVEMIVARFILTRKASTNHVMQLTEAIETYLHHDALA